LPFCRIERFEKEEKLVALYFYVFSVGEMEKGKLKSKASLRLCNF
jgi:hypothetical protein